MLDDLQRTLRTVAHLRPDQLLHRARFRVRRAWWERRCPAIDARYRTRAGWLSPLRWDHPGLARVVAWRVSLRSEPDALANARRIRAGSFEFLGRTEHFGEEVDWFRPELDEGTRLWKTHLHEFSYALDLAQAQWASDDPSFGAHFLELARSWRSAAPIGCRDFALDAWNARAVATRMIHWAVAGRHLDLATVAPQAATWLGREIGLHGLFLRDNLELDLRGNHLFRDAVGLVFAEELCGGVADAIEWLERQVAEQVLPDGAHVERAPYYHALCTQDLFEVRLLLGERSPAWLDHALARMAALLETLQLGDGEIPLLGDGWLGEVDTQAVLAAVAGLELPAAPRPDPAAHSGLVSLREGPWRLVLRAGAHAPDEQMGHAHADLLSFDLSHDTRRIVSDTGTLHYDPGPERERLRSTAAHNTLRLAREEQIEAWGSFRVGRRGRARVQTRGQQAPWQWVSASHDAYRHLPGHPEHHRLWLLSQDALLVLDAVFGPAAIEVESHLHLHPDAEASGLRIVALDGPSERAPAPLHERYGQTLEATRLRRALRASLPWAGGWWIGPDASDTSEASEAARPALHQPADAESGRIELHWPARELRLSWTPQMADPSTGVVLYSASPDTR